MAKLKAEVEYSERTNRWKVVVEDEEVLVGLGSKREADLVADAWDKGFIKSLEVIKKALI